MDEILNRTTIMAALGGLAVNLLGLAELFKVPKERRPDLWDWLYWVPFVVWPFLGGLVAYAYEKSGTQFNPILALNVGASAPLIIRAMAAANPLGKTIDPGAGA